MQRLFANPGVTAAGSDRGTYDEPFLYSSQPSIVEPIGLGI